MSRSKIPVMSRVALAIIIASSCATKSYASIDTAGTVIGTTSQPPTGNADWNDVVNSIRIGNNTVGGGIESSSLTIFGGSRLAALEIIAGSGAGGPVTGNMMSLMVSGTGSTLTLQNLSTNNLNGYSTFTTALTSGAQAAIGIITGRMSLSISGVGSSLTSDSISLMNSIVNISEGGAIISSNPIVLTESTLNIGSTLSSGGDVDIPVINLAGQNSKIIFQQNDDRYEFGSDVTGAGGISVVNTGTTVLTGNNDYTGSTSVSRGTLQAGADNTFSAGSTYITGVSGIIDTNGHNLTMAAVNNSGEMLVRGYSAAQVRIAGSYIGSGVLSISGNGSELNVDERITNTGIIQVTNGGELTTDSLTNDGGRILVSGAGSSLDVSGLFSNSGQAQFRDGVDVSAGSVDNSAMTLLISGSSTLFQIDNQLKTSGALQISDGAVLSAGTLTNYGGVLLSGKGSKIDVSGLLDSSGSLLVQDNSMLTAETAIIKGSSTSIPSTLNIGNVRDSPAANAGTINVANVVLASTSTSRAVVNLNHTNTRYDFSPSITGNGDVYSGFGVTTLTGHNTYSGVTEITGGTLKAGAEGVLSSNSTYTVNYGGTLDLNGFTQTLSNIYNAGFINLAGTTAGSVLTVNGDYTGNNGTLLFGTELGDDSATSDRLVVTGDATGTTNVRVSNLGGHGAETLNGIELIEVQGSADSSAFTQQGRIVAGAYDYRLVRGSQNWYLSSKIDLETGLPIIGDGDGENAGGGGENPGGGEGGGGGESVMVLRPEGGAYAANLATASTMFDTRMSDRQGTYYLDPVTGEEMHTSLWLRMAGDHNRLNAGSGQLSTRANSFVTMLGGDVAATDNARLGLMAGYGNSKSNSESKITGYRAKGQINGYTTGAYGTWFAEGTDEKGPWADSTLQYSWFTNSVDGEDVAGEQYRSGGLSASLSTGYVIPLGKGERTAFFLQPQARVGWSGIKADDHTERNGTLVQGSGQDNLSTSLGVKAFMKGHSKLDDSTGRQFGLFTEANWIHNSNEYAVRMDDVSVSQSGSRNIAEARVGVDGALGNGFGVKGTVGQQVGDGGWSDTSAIFGISYTF